MIIHEGWKRTTRCFCSNLVVVTKEEQKTKLFQPCQELQPPTKWSLSSFFSKRTFSCPVESQNTFVRDSESRTKYFILLPKTVYLEDCSRQQPTTIKVGETNQTTLKCSRMPQPSHTISTVYSRAPVCQTRLDIV